MDRHEVIEHHASFHLYQLKLESEAARNGIESMHESARAEIIFNHRSAGQKRRYQKLKAKGEKQ